MAVALRSQPESSCNSQTRLLRQDLAPQRCGDTFVSISRVIAVVLVCAALPNTKAVAQSGANTAIVASAPNAGSRAFLQCRSCHTLQAGGPDNVGPNLFGFWGKKAGTNRPGFSYSAQMRASPVTWTEANLDKFLERPTAVIPGTKMAFVGLARRDQRQALIAYLRQATTATPPLATQSIQRK
jgi:cytochrome c